MTPTPLDWLYWCASALVIGSFVVSVGVLLYTVIRYRWENRDDQN